MTEEKEEENKKEKKESKSSWLQDHGTFLILNVCVLIIVLFFASKINYNQIVSTDSLGDVFGVRLPNILLIIFVLTVTALYRFFSDGRFDSLVSVIVLFDLIQAATIMGAAKGNSSEAMTPITSTILLLPFILAFYLIFVLVWQDKVSKKFARTIILQNVKQNNVSYDLVEPYLKLAEVLVEVDMMPGSFPESLLGRKKEYRELFLALLPSEIFNTEQINKDSLLLSAKDRRKFAYMTRTIATSGGFLFVTMLLFY